MRRSVLDVVASLLQLRVQVVEGQQGKNGNGQTARRGDQRFGDGSRDGLRTFDLLATDKTKGVDHARDRPQQTKKRSQR